MSLPRIRHCCLTSDDISPPKRLSLSLPPLKWRSADRCHDDSGAFLVIVSRRADSVDNGCVNHRSDDTISRDRANKSTVHSWIPRSEQQLYFIRETAFSRMCSSLNVAILRYRHGFLFIYFSLIILILINIQLEDSILKKKYITNILQ